MIFDFLEVFRKEYEAKGDNLILGNYQLKDGLYAKIADDGCIEYYESKTVKKERIFCKLNGNIDDKALEWFKKADYYSCYLNSNKAFDDKKIHNVNYLSFFAKMESFDEKSDKRLADGAIKEQYKALCNYKKFKKPKERDALKQYVDLLANRDRRKDLIKKYRFVQMHIDEIVQVAKENKITNYVKLFFEAPIEKYIEESEIYYAIKIFNDIEHSESIRGKTYGLSDSNMGLNAKKPYLEHKTKTQEVPFMVLDTDALLIKKFFDWLKYQDYQNKYPAGNMFFINRDFKAQDIITDFDHLPAQINRLERSIYLKNHLQIVENKTLIDDDTIDTLAQLEAVVDDVLYNKQLIYNYYGEVYNKLDKAFANLIYITREAMINYFKKFDDTSFYQVIAKYGLELVLFHLRQERELKAQKSMNLILSLKNHNGAKAMDIQALQKKMINKLEASNYDSLDSEEFFYLSGQVAKYLLSKSKSGKKDADMLEPFLRAKSVKKLKDEIKFTFFKYKHEIGLNQTKFNNALAVITAYEENDAFNSDAFLVGVLSQNLFYVKKEGE